ncbi:heavy-metal-associated domain-containing protein [Candidatus Woesebacteria bacterium]|nr:heavy-metal-associated domain-containing protein [Candidatus Woesebacteria bacterium]
MSWPFQKKRVNTAQQTIIFDIAGMHCSNCSLNIDGELEELHGVISAETSYRKSVTKVVYDATCVDEQKITQQITALGYTVTSRTD